MIYKTIMVKTVIFARVSTSSQEYDRQVNELTMLANANGWSIESVFAEKVSGAKANSDRTELLNMIQYVEVNNIDKVLHFLMYFGFCAVLWFEYFKSHTHPDATRLIPWAIVAPILFSGLIEIGQQTLTPTRAADWRDFLFNTLGCLTAAIFSQLVTRKAVRRWMPRTKGY